MLTLFYKCSQNSVSIMVGVFAHNLLCFFVTQKWDYTKIY
jgi:hypothetical protein